MSIPSTFRVRLFFAFLSLCGLISLGFLRTSFLPDDHATTISFRFSWADNNAIELERQVTSLLEARLSAIRAIEDIRSYSLANYGLIQVTVDDQTDIARKHHEIIKLFRSVDQELPKGVMLGSPEIIQSDQNDFILALTTTDRSFGYQRARDTFLYDLKKLDANLIEQGQTVIPYDQLTPIADISSMGIGLTQIRNAFVNRQKTNVLGHLSNTKPVLLSSKHTRRTLDNIEIQNENGHSYPIWLLFSHNKILPDPPTIHKINGQHTQFIHFKPHENVNPILFHARLTRFIKSNQQKLRQKGFELRLINNPIQKFLDELKSMAIRVAISLSLLLVVIYLFYRNLKHGFIVLLSLSVTVLCAISVIYLFDIEINLYSLAGVALSFGLIVDNILVTMHHLISGRPTGHRFAIIAATVSSVGTSFTIFLLPREQAILLEGFVFIIAVSLIASLLISLILIPRIMTVNTLEQNSQDSHNQADNTFWGNLYMWTASMLMKWRKVTLFSLVLLFGLPVYLLPSESNTNTPFDDFYDNLIASENYLDHIKPFIESYLGGFSTRFKHHIENAEGISLAPEPPQTLNVRYDSPLKINRAAVIRIHNEFESYLKSFNEVKQFQSTINEESFDIVITFKENHPENFPRILAGLLDQKARQHTGAKFRITMKELSFNSGSFQTNSSGIRIKGYNYDQILRLCSDIELELKKNNRIENISLSTNGRSIPAYILSLASNDEVTHPRHMAPFRILDAISKHSANEVEVFLGDIAGTPTRITLNNPQKDFWSLQQYPIVVEDENIRLGPKINLKSVKREPYIQRLNQQYIVDLTYDYLGPNIQASRYRNNLLITTNANFPLGFTAEKLPNGFEAITFEDQKWTIIVAILIVFVISAILLESIMKSLWLVFYLLISLTGVFIGFLITSAKFDLGAVTAIIFLCGLIVNNAFYVLTELLALIKQEITNTTEKQISLWIEALRKKSPSILMTSLTSIVGLFPFLFFSSKEMFWYQFSLCTVSGLSFSLVLLYLFLPTIFGPAIFSQKN